MVLLDGSIYIVYVWAGTGLLICDIFDSKCNTICSRCRACNATQHLRHSTAEESAQAEAAASLSNVLFDIATCCIQNTKQAISKNSAQRAKNV